MMYQGAVAKFDKKTENFQNLEPSPEDNKVLHTNHSDRCHALQGGWKGLGADAGTYSLRRLDPVTGQFEVFPAISRAQPEHLRT